MAILWQKKQNNVLYQVRTAGKTRRLYADGVCHTQFHPDRIVTGSVWDLLLLPCFFQNEVKVRKVLLLGLGGGALVHLLRHFLSPENITAIELEPVHIYVANRFFNAGGRGVDIIESDARVWLRQYQGEKFDLIVDDLFSHQDGVPQRAVAANRAWFNLLRKNLAADGLLTMNYADRRELNASSFMTDCDTYQQFASAYQFSNKLLDNRIVCFSRDLLDRRGFNQRLKTHREFNNARSLSYNIRKIK